MSVQERLGKVQYRSKQAENALKQLETCIKVINNKKQDDSAVPTESSDELQYLEEENRQLVEEAAVLKQKLIKLEFLNGVQQIPYSLPSDNQSVATPQETHTLPPQETHIPEQDGCKPKQNGGSEKKKTKEKQPKVGGGAQGGDRPIDVSRLDMRIGRILTVKKHPDADTLYVEEIDVGEDAPRTVCSGLVKNIPINEMENRMIVVMCNLKPAKMRGVVSQAMVMCASSPDKVELLDPPEGVVPGDRVVVEGYSGEPDEVLNPKKKIFEQVQPDLLTNEKGVACYKGVPWTVHGKGVMKSQTMTNSPIK